MCDWHDKQFQVLLRQQETIWMAREDVIAWEARMADHKTLLDAREQEISLREERLEATLHTKVDALEVLERQLTKELEDKHKAAMDALTTDSAARLMKFADDLAIASTAKVDLDLKLDELREKLAGSTGEVSVPKEEAQKAESRETKSQGLETTNSIIEDLKAGIGSLESSIEYVEAHEKQLSRI